MPAAPKLERISIGFHGGQVLSVRVAAKELAALQRALDKGDGWYQLEVEDGAVHVALSTVVYLRTESNEPRVGFGA
jgi:hypothetical protein